MLLTFDHTEPLRLSITRNLHRLLRWTLCLCMTVLLLSQSGLALAREVRVTMSDGSEVKVFLFEPDNHGEGPWPLSVLIPGGGGNEYVARAQFWLGRELARQGWMIAVPVSTDGSNFDGQNGYKIPAVIERLQSQADILSGKALLVGVSTGGSSALALAAQQPDQYHGVVAVPGILRDLSIIQDMNNLPVYVRIAQNDLFRWDQAMPDMVTALEQAGARVNAGLVTGTNAKHIFNLDWDELRPWIDALHAHEPSSD
ncbi:alpha/beta hydrolase-fold protein [Pseudohongiella sp. SYSU M77423]|uniref:dienelactone hydrolase family protein n=1 Tax=Pseudohongiella sp. SYSU M77423 TaxID=3042312 RepID=UPI00247FDB23|nr:alpha/beta hydrolase-fold protein [Pseudohongiella sp. SYSU M77423]MDH7943627.1 alpha/beta hydrolase-fold protein [Pseudohongiella sp. SYSU M77423]